MRPCFGELVGVWGTVGAQLVWGPRQWRELPSAARHSGVHARIRTSSSTVDRVLFQCLRQSGNFPFASVVTFLVAKSMILTLRFSEELNASRLSVPSGDQETPRPASTSAYTVAAGLFPYRSVSI